MVQVITHSSPVRMAPRHGTHITLRPTHRGTVVESGRSRRRSWNGLRTIRQTLVCHLLLEQYCLVQMERHEHIRCCCVRCISQSQKRKLPIRVRVGVVSQPSLAASRTDAHFYHTVTLIHIPRKRFPSIMMVQQAAVWVMSTVLTNFLRKTRFGNSLSAIRT